LQSNLRVRSNAPALVQTAQTTAIVAVKLTQNASSHAIEEYECHSRTSLGFASVESTEVGL